jgi:hypothetical protein
MSEMSGLGVRGREREREREKESKKMCIPVKMCVSMPKILCKLR